MKKRVSRVVNFFAFNLLFFALYLNFVHKDNNTVPTSTPAHPTAAVNQTVLVENPEQYLKKDQQTASNNTQIAKASIN
jgi:hypothetical protein